MSEFYRVCDEIKMLFQDYITINFLKHFQIKLFDHFYIIRVNK